MKKIGICLLLLLPLMSCNDWLNVESEESVTYQSFFKSEDDIEATLNGMFITERGLTTKSPWPVEFAGLYCDELDQSGLKTLDPDRFINKKGSTETGGNSWGGFYELIYMTNLLEENRYRFEGITEERTEFWLAQANFMKAWAYFRVAQLWGDAPIPANSSDLDAIGKSPVKEVLNEALKAAEKALILPPKEELKDAHGQSITSKQYASIGTVYTLLANIYAWMGGLYNETEYWQKAADYATRVIGDGPEGKIAGVYQLEDSIPDLITNVFGPKRNSSEIIFSITYSNMDYDFPSRLIPYSYIYPGYLLITYPVITTSPWDVEDNFGYLTKARIEATTVQELFSLENDARTKEYWTEELDWGYTYAFLNKWRKVITSGQSDDQEALITAIDADRVIWRLADLILLRAECYTRLNQTAAAIADLNLIRKRADAELYSGAGNAETIRREIFMERERELFGEGQHYYDAVRNGINPRNNWYLGRIAPVYTQLSDADIKNGALYLPVNTEAFTKNLYMTQNTYWLWRQ